MLLQTQDMSPSYGRVGCRGEIGSSLQNRACCFKREERKPSHPICKERNSAQSWVSPWDTLPIKGVPASPPILKSPGIKQGVSTGLHFKEENTNFNPNTGFGKDQMAQESPKITKTHRGTPPSKYSPCVYETQASPGPRCACPSLL